MDLLFVWFFSCSEETHEAGLNHERGVEEHVWVSGADLRSDRHGNTVFTLVRFVWGCFYYVSKVSLSRNAWRTSLADLK